MRFELPRTGVLEAIERELESTPVLLLTAPRGGGKSHLVNRLHVRSLSRGTSTALVRLEPVSGSPEILDSELARLAGSILGRVAARGTPAFDSVLRRLAQTQTDSLLFLDDVTVSRPGFRSTGDRFLVVLRKR